MTWLATKLGLSALEISWKWIGVGLAVIGLLCVIGFGYLHVENLKSDLLEKTEQLAVANRKAEEAHARADAVKKEHDDQVARIETLEHQRTEIAVEVTKLRTELAKLDLEQDLESDDEQKADAAIGRLNAAHARVNGLLRAASGAKDGVRSGQAAGSKARAAGAGSALQRALQALRKDGVSDAR
jgi:chromosome segregation ATPase